MQSPSLKDHPVPRRAHAIGMWLFLASLGMLFGASMFGYVLIRVLRSDVAFHQIQLPRELWLSTLLILSSSFTMQRALSAIRIEKQSLFRIYLSATLMFAGLFVCIQTPAMAKLWHEHNAAMNQWRAEQTIAATQPTTAQAPIAELSDGDIIHPKDASMPFYGLVMFLILVHALHVIGGMVALGIVAWFGYRGAYDHESHAGVRNCTLYWHFLDIVWIVMFTVISAFG